MVKIIDLNGNDHYAETPAKALVNTSIANRLI
jgi:hypothetical protein